MDNKLFNSSVLKKLVEIAIDDFISKDRVLLQRGLSERALCGALMKRLYDVLGSKGYEEFKDYFVDVEFNRRSQNKAEKGKKMVDNSELKKIYDVKKIISYTQDVAKEGRKRLKKIFTDIIVHGRGVLKDDLPDNLIAIEMKKKLRDTKGYNAKYDVLKEYDVNRLKQFTCSNEKELKKFNLYNYQENEDDVIIYGYKLGVFVEVNYKNNCINYTFFRHAENDGNGGPKSF